MKLLIKKCFSCGALGIGPNAVKLWPFEGRLYCREHYKDPLTWHESRSEVVRGITSMAEQDAAVARVRRWGRKIQKIPKQDWGPYIAEHAELAAWAMTQGDKRTFTYYFSRAVWAWALKEAK